MIVVYPCEQHSTDERSEIVEHCKNHKRLAPFAGRHHFGHHRLKHRQHNRTECIENTAQIERQARFRQAVKGSSQYVSQTADHSNHLVGMIKIYR